jgi:cytochrome b561
MSSTRVAPAAAKRGEQYAPAMRRIHWLTAAMVLLLFVCGGWTHYFDPGEGLLKDLLYNLHQSFGVTVWLLVLLRVVLRIATGAPKLPPGTPAAIRVAASLNHLALYLVLLVQPVTGFLDTNANGFPLAWFGLFEVPSPIGKQPDAVAHALDGMHWFGALALLLLVGSHLAGAAYHGLIRRDGVLRHML